MAESLCWVKLPRAGLGNKLLVWGRGAVFSRMNDLPLYTSGFNSVRLGPVIRFERRRFYFRQFRKTGLSNYYKYLRARIFLPRVMEPPVTSLKDPEARLYVFHRIPHWKDYFSDIREHRDLIRSALLDSVSLSVHKVIERSAPPFVSIHVRHGDFRPLAAGEDFARVGSVRTPLDYFEHTINLVRDIAGKSLPVAVFSDGAERDLNPLLRLSNVWKYPLHSAITDLLLMSRSKIIIPSAGSTFGYWSAFLSNAVIMLHPQHIHSPIRPNEVNRMVFEGPTPAAASLCPALLRENIRAIGDEI